MLMSHDLHTHTRYSDGSSTPYEMVRSGRDKGLETIAITDHGPELSIGIESGQIRQLVNDVSLAREDVDLDVLVGLEANTTGSDGGIDLDAPLIENLDIVLAGVHYLRTSGLSQDRTAEIYLETVVNMMERQDIDILVHPFWYHEDLSEYLPKSDIRDFAKVARHENVTIEVNERYCVPGKEILSACAEEGTKFSLGSDAHKPDDVGELDWAMDRAESVGIEERDLFVNCL